MGMATAHRVRIATTVFIVTAIGSFAAVMLLSAIAKLVHLPFWGGTQQVIVLLMVCPFPTALGATVIYWWVTRPQRATIPGVAYIPASAAAEDWPY